VKATNKILFHVIPPHGDFPNNPRLPLLIYKHALPFFGPQEVASLFNRNGWKRSWTNGIYPFHHYHSNTHEVLGICSGKCQIQIGGEGGTFFDVSQGDVLILSAGISHKNLGSSEDFICVGAYPLDISYDMNYGKPGEIQRTAQAIEKVPLPKSDPLYGPDGPLFDHWKP
jgi:uncharacterized protein YjlB